MFLVCIGSIINVYNDKSVQAYEETITRAQVATSGKIVATRRASTKAHVVTPTVTPTPNPQRGTVYKVTAYCPCARCCGKSDGITATGTKALAGRTIAVDPNQIPLGSKVLIGGKTYVAEDTGGAIKGCRIYMFFNSHQEAERFGVQNLPVVVVGRT